MAHPDKFRFDRRQVVRRVTDELRATPTQPVAVHPSELKYFRSRDFEEMMLSRLHSRVTRHYGAKVDMTVVHSKRQKLKAIFFTVI